MKKLIYSLFVLAATAITFTSCEDVPAPYAQPGGDEPAVIDPTGSGTLDDPYNVAAVLEYVNSLAADEESPQDVYIKGKVASININYNESEAQFGNAVFYISDDGANSKQFYVYRALYRGNKKYTSGATLQKGDEVIICGKVINYRGTTPETVQSKAFLYSLNGQTEGGGVTPTAIEINCAKAVELTSALADNATSSELYAVTGYITEVVGSVSRNQQTFWMADTKDGGKVFEAYYANLPEGVSEFKKGSKVKIIGNLLKYVNSNTGAMTPEIKNAYVVILEEGEGGGGDSGGGGGGSQSHGTLDGNVLTLVSANLNVENGKEPGTITLVDGSTIVFDGGGNTNTPKYYSSGTSIRMYPKNKMTITAKGKKIVSVTLTCTEQSGTLCNASGEVGATPGSVAFDGNLVKVTGVDNASVVVTNNNGSTGAASQLRFSTLVITYAE